MLLSSHDRNSFKWTPYLLVGVFVSLQGLHDGELCIVFEPPGLLAENLPQHPQSQCSDDMLGEFREKISFYRKSIQTHFHSVTTEKSVCTSLSPIVSSRSSRMVLKCSSHTCRVFSRISFSSSHSAAFLSSMRSLWLDNSFSSSATSSDWSRLLSVKT